jgi:hypothetical protein
MHRALHLSVKKALGMVASHYQVDFEAVSSCYIVPVGVEDDEAMNRADALAAMLQIRLPRILSTSYSQMLLAPATLKPEDHWASNLFLFKHQCWGHVAM